VAIIPFGCFAASPYAGEQSQSIKSLSQQETADYLSGKSMGFAKAAEINGYPGPGHVLELADKLALSLMQKAKTEEVFDKMQRRARELGSRLVDAEKRLDESFASKTVSRESLATSVNSIATIQGEIRAAHLQAHLAQNGILTPAQKAEYWRLRGYADARSPQHHQHSGSTP
jgi:Spy/CpxP family protein refolding chaperone